MSWRSLLMLVLAVTCLAAAVWVRPGVEPANRPVQWESRHPSKMVRAEAGPTGIDWSRPVFIGDPQVAAMPLSRVLELLPVEAYETRDLEAAKDPLRDDLLRRLGQLLGEAGVDEVISRYGRTTCGMDAVGLVMAGWMSLDPDAATEAFLAMIPRDFMVLGGPIVLGSPISPSGTKEEALLLWKGQPLSPDEWGDFALVPRWELYGRVLDAATRVDPERGKKLLESGALVTEFNVLVRSYVDALNHGSDWPAVHAELTEIADRQQVHMPNGWDPIPSAVAQRWAATDMNAAMDWMLGIEGRGGSPVPKRQVAEVLSSNGIWEGVKWLESHAGQPEVDDDLLIMFAQRGVPTDDKAKVFEALSAVASGEDARGALSFALYPPSPIFRNSADRSGGNSLNGWVPDLRGELGARILDARRTESE